MMLIAIFLIQGIVIGTGENSQFGEVFKLMQAEEVRDKNSVCFVGTVLCGTVTGPESPHCYSNTGSQMAVCR